VIVLDLPLPISVNESRRIDWRTHKKVRDWTKQADALFLMQKRRLGSPIAGRFEVTITLPESCPLDADNCVKLPIDVLRRFGLITNDSPKFMRRVTVEFGEAPAGCRVTVKPFP
jgi:Holliday junction resolvase RusA-like endonuclease